MNLFRRVYYVYILECPHCNSARAGNRTCTSLLLWTESTEKTGRTTGTARSDSSGRLIIDKKRLKLKESGLPQIVIDQTPWYMRRTKIPVVKAKIGPKIQTLISETTIFDSIPVKKEIKAVVSGIYITEIKSVRGGRVEAPQQKKSLRVRLSEKLLRKSKELNASAAEDSKGKKKKK